MNQANSIYKRAIVFSGGGTRYAIYGGMFAALEEYGMKPDVIISTCGGSIAAAVINSFATNQERKAYFQSAELFDFIRTIRLSRERMIHRIGFYCLRIMGNKQKAPYIRNVFDRYLVDMPQDMVPLLPSLQTAFDVHVPCVMIGSEILFDRSETEQPRADRLLYRKVLFTGPQTAGRIDTQKAGNLSESYKGSAVAPDTCIDTDTSVPLAMRISLSDMFYVQPVYYKNRYYAGGIIDLLPVELAESLAETVIFEKKSPFTFMEEGLVRAVFGYNGNERIAEVEKRNIQHWIDTTDIIQALKGHYVRKKIDFLRWQVQVTLPETYQQFKEDAEVQWNYGYECVQKMITSNRNV